MRSQPIADAPQNLSIRIGKVARHRRPVQREQHTIDRPSRIDRFQQLGGKPLEGLRRKRAARHGEACQRRGRYESKFARALQESSQFVLRALPSLDQLAAFAQAG